MCNCLLEPEAWRELLDWSYRPGVICTQVKVKAMAQMPPLRDTMWSRGHRQRKNIMKRKLKKKVVREVGENQQKKK